MINNKTGSTKWANQAKAIATAAVIALLMAACGGGDGASETAAAQDNVVGLDAADTTAADPAAGTNDESASGSAAGAEQATGSTDADPAAASTKQFTIEQAQQMHRDFTSCMRDQGVDTPPAAFAADGRIDLVAELEYYESQGEQGTATSQADLNAQQVEWEAASEACTSDDYTEADVQAMYALISPTDSEIDELNADMDDDFEETLVAVGACMREAFPDFPNPVLPDFDAMGDDQTTEFSPFPGIDLQDPLYTDQLTLCADRLGLDMNE